RHGVNKEEVVNILFHSALCLHASVANSCFGALSFACLPALHLRTNSWAVKFIIPIRTFPFKVHFETSARASYDARPVLQIFFPCEGARHDRPAATDNSLHRK